MPGDDAENFLPLTPRLFHILLALAERERHGYGIMQAVRERSNQRVSIGAGTLYEALHRATESGLICESATLPSSGEDQRRRYYRLTPTGMRVVRLETERLLELVSFAQRVTDGPKT